MRVVVPEARAYEGDDARVRSRGRSRRETSFETHLGPKSRADVVNVRVDSSSGDNEFLSSDDLITERGKKERGQTCAKED